MNSICPVTMVNSKGENNVAGYIQDKKVAGISKPSLNKKKEDT
jgi:GTP cyclohydrolase I